MLNYFKKLLWFVDIKKIDQEKDKDLIIHQTLSLGSLMDIKKLLKLYSKRRVRNIFLKGRSSRGSYDPRVLELLKIMLGVKKIKATKYVKKIQ